MKEVRQVMSKEDLLEAQDLINNEKAKLKQLVFDIVDNKLSNKEIVNRILELDVSAAVTNVLSSEVIEEEK